MLKTRKKFSTKEWGDNMLDWLRKLSRKHHKGILIGWIVYKPEIESPNVFFNMHPDLANDEYLSSQCKLIAEHIRKYYGDWEG